MDENETNGQQIPPKVDLRKQMASPPPADGHKHTTQIEMDDLQASAKGASAVPPANPPQRPTVVVKPIPPQGGSGRMETMLIEAADLVSDARKSPSATVPVTPVVAPPAKRETSRIPLEMAKPTLGAAPSRPVTRNAAPSTIRVKPVVIRQTVDLAQAAPDQTAAERASPGAPAPQPATASPAEAGKRKTSRIALESALGAPSAAAAAPAAGPAGDDEQRTIRLRRTSEPLAKKTVSITDLGADVGAAEPEAVPREGEAPATRKKTIKVRRAGETGDGAAPAEVARPAPSMAAGAERADDRPHALFGWTSGVGVAVCLVVIYVLMAQVFGPDISLTKLSYGWPEFDVSWPGKIAR